MSRDDWGCYAVIVMIALVLFFINLLWTAWVFQCDLWQAFLYLLWRG